MPKELRLAFAMGGGVSLGTFSGAALTEALKLAVLRGGFAANGGTEAYARVIVDVFSGASAGAMSLAAMLRSLIAPAPSDLAKAREFIVKRYPVEFAKLSPIKQQQLIAAQVAQDTQASIWGSEVTLDRLLGKRDGRDLSAIGSVLDRRAVDEIAAHVLDVHGTLDCSGRALLGDRVLFACALTNLTPILNDARTDLSAVDIGLMGLADGLTSYTHRELRVFDLSFKPMGKGAVKDPELYPARWCRYQNGKEIPGEVGDLRLRKSWAKIAATAIASGAFPVAFEPVVLMRSCYEFGNLWPKDLPKGTKKDPGEHPFTYVDGGFLNNEPIREAFRLAAFMDAGCEKESFDRRIIFVDPNVASPATSLTVPIHSQFGMSKPNVFGSFDGYDLYRKNSLDRIFANLMPLIGAIVNEATAIEGDKIFQVRDRFTVRNNTRALIARTQPTATPGLFADLITWCTEQLNRQRLDDVIPPGTLTIGDELRRVIAEERSTKPDPAEQERYNHLIDEIPEFLTDPESAPEQDRSIWLKLLLFIAVDLALSLEGKHYNSRLVAISPMLNATDPDRRQPIALPGGAVAGFGGFTSRLCAQYEIEMGRHCTRDMLEACGVVSADPMPPPVPTWTATQERAFREDLKRGLGHLSERLAAMIKSSHLIAVFPGLDSTILWAIAKFVTNLLENLSETGSTAIARELRIKVFDRKLELDGSGWGNQDLNAIALAGPDDWHLILPIEVTVANGTCTWTGPYINQAKQTVSFDVDGLFGASSWCTAALPALAQVQAASRLPNPIFCLEITKSDKGKRIPASRWTLQSGVHSLDTTIFP